MGVRRIRAMFQALEQLKTNGGVLAAMPVVVFTGLHDAEVAFKAVEAYPKNGGPLSFRKRNVKLGLLARVEKVRNSCVNAYEAPSRVAFDSTEDPPKVSAQNDALIGLLFDYANEATRVHSWMASRVKP